MGRLSIIDEIDSNGIMNGEATGRARQWEWSVREYLFERMRGTFKQ